MTAKIETTERTPRLTHLPRCTKLTDPERYACNCGADGLAAKLDAADPLATVPAEERTRILEAAGRSARETPFSQDAARDATIAREVAAWHAERAARPPCRVCDRPRPDHGGEDDGIHEDGVQVCDGYEPAARPAPAVDAPSMREALTSICHGASLGVDTSALAEIARKALDAAPTADASLEARGKLAADAFAEAIRRSAEGEAIEVTSWLAVVRAVDASRPGLTEEQARELAADVATSFNARWSIGLGQGPLKDMADRIEAGVLRASRGDTGPAPDPLATVPAAERTRILEAADRAAATQNVHRDTIAREVAAWHAAHGAPETLTRAEAPAARVTEDELREIEQGSDIEIAVRLAAEVRARRHLEMQKRTYLRKIEELRAELRALRAERDQASYTIEALQAERESENEGARQLMARVAALESELAARHAPAADALEEADRVAREKWGPGAVGLTQEDADRTDGRAPRIYDGRAFVEAERSAVVRAVDASRPAAPEVDAEDLWTDYRTGRPHMTIADRVAFLAGVEAGRRTSDASRPGLTEEQAQIARAEPVIAAWLDYFAAMDRQHKSGTAADARTVRELRAKVEAMSPSVTDIVYFVALARHRARGEVGPAATGLTRAMHAAQQRPSTPPASPFGEWPEPAHREAAAVHPTTAPSLGTGIGGDPIKIRPTRAELEAALHDPDTAEGAAALLADMPIRTPKEP